MGRKSGTPNKITAEIRNRLETLIEANNIDLLNHPHILINKFRMLIVYLGY